MTEPADEKGQKRRRRKRSKPELEAENRLLRKWRSTEGTVSVVNTVLKFGAFVLIARYGYLAIDALAGQKTVADIGLNLLSDIKISTAAAWTLAGGGILYGRRQRKLKKDTIERLSSRIKDLERRIDPGRTSSQLTERGDTREEDR